MNVKVLESYTGNPISVRTTMTKEEAAAEIISRLGRHFRRSAAAKELVQWLDDTEEYLDEYYPLTEYVVVSNANPKALQSPKNAP